VVRNTVGVRYSGFSYFKTEMWGGREERERRSSEGNGTVWEGTGRTIQQPINKSHVSPQQLNDRFPEEKSKRSR